MIVVDCSVLAGFAIASDDYHHMAERALQKDGEWHAPDLIRSEFRSVGNGHLKKGSAREVVETAASLADDVITHFHRMEHRAVFDVLSKAPLSAYDAEYVALALQLQCKLVTTDRDVLKWFPDCTVRLQDFAT